MSLVVAGLDATLPTKVPGSCSSFCVKRRSSWARDAEQMQKATSAIALNGGFDAILVDSICICVLFVSKLSSSWRKAFFFACGERIFTRL